jgi:hypothetical protein
MWWRISIDRTWVPPPSSKRANKRSRPLVHLGQRSGGIDAFITEWRVRMEIFQQRRSK